MQENNTIINNNNVVRENQPAKAKPSTSNKSKEIDKRKPKERYVKDKPKKVTTSTQLESSVKINNQKANSKNKTENKTENNKVNLYDYKKRKGTACLSGQLYKTKLLALILHRALYNDQITDFLLGTNMEGIGEFDDVILRYEINDVQISKIIFLQAKHRDDSTREVTYEDFLKHQGDFSFFKYFESYIKIKQNFANKNNNLMFRGPTKDIVCDFIIYTPATAKFSQNRIKYCEEESLIRSTKHGKTFQLQYDSEDVKVLIHNLARSRAIVLAKTLLKFVLKDNNSFNIIMLDDLMQTYHVFLAQNVIVGEDRPESIWAEDGVPYFMAKFRESFLTSNECYLQLMKNVIYREIAEIKGISSINQQQEVDNILRSLVFKLPVNFGNQFFHLLSYEKRQERTFLCSSILKKLLDSVNSRDDTQLIDSNYSVIKLGNNLISDSENLQSRELEAESGEHKNLYYRLGELVGNILIMDDKTDMLKFNLDMQSLSKDNTKILENLQEFKEDLTKYRFDVHLSKFPRLCLIRTEHDRLLLINFLNYLKFYTNQAKEDEVENILQKEIDRFCNIQQKQNDSLIRVKCDAIFLKVHDMVLKWWQQPDLAPYLNKTCTFYHHAEMEIIDSPLLNINHFIYREKLKYLPVEFNKDAMHSLRINCFLESKDKNMVVFSEDVDFTSIKVIQYYDEIINELNYIIVDLDCMITENCSEIIKSELCKSLIPTMILVTKKYKDIDRLLIKLKNITEPFKGNIVIVTNSIILKDTLKTVTNDFKNIFYIDDKNDFNSLSMKCRNMILRERKITFQGESVTIETAFNETSLNLLSLKLLKEIIYNKNIEIGKALVTNSYRLVECYIDRNINRAIPLNNYTRIEKELNIYTIEDGVDANLTRAPDESSDIVVISKSIEKFEEVCKKYNNANIHWCNRIDNDCLLWERSQGSIKNIMKYTTRASKLVDVNIKTLKDVEDKIVILKAEPGEGKSTLLAHLAIKTKHHHPDLWLLRINFLEYIDQFNNWKEHKTQIDLVKAMLFLYSTAGFKDFSHEDIQPKNIVSANSGNEIYFNNSNYKALCSVDLSLVQLFTYFYNNNKLAVLFDGFDEICPDYSNEVLKLLSILKSSKVKHLWVTTRPFHVLGKLEITLGTFSYHLMGFNPLDQRIFLQNVWSKRLNLNGTLDTTDIFSYVDKFLTIVTSLLNDNISAFTNYALHLYMIAELYQDDFRNFVLSSGNPDSDLHRDSVKTIRKASNLSKIYEQFTNMKFYTIRFAEKNQSVNLKHPDTRRLVEKERKEFVDIHQKASAFDILNKKIMLTEDDISDVFEFFDTIRSGEEKTGIVELGLSRYPGFVHMTFAEYFAVEFIFNKLRTAANTEVLWQYLINDIMINKEGIQRFVNSKLQDDTVMTELISNEEHMRTIRNIILQNCSIFSTAIYIAIDQYNENSAIFLLRCIKFAINKGNLLTFLELFNKIYRKHCIFCIAVERDLPLIVKQLIELVADIDSDKVINLFNCLDFSKLNPIVLIKNEQMTYFILNIIQNYPPTALKLFNSDLKLCQYKYVYTIINGFQKMCRNYLLLSLTKEQRVQIFSFKDMCGKLPVHQAAKENDYDFFIAMDELVGRQEFKNMCLTPDNHGLVSIHNFPYDEIGFDKFKNILEIIYEDINLDEVKCKFNELSKLDS